MQTEFFEGSNLYGDAELFNNAGRKERDSFVDILQSGPGRVWVRWTYFWLSANRTKRIPIPPARNSRMTTPIPTA